MLWDASLIKGHAIEADDGRLGAVSVLVAGERGPVTLLYSAHDREHNGALVLAQYLTQRWRARRPKVKRAKPRSSRSR